MRLEDLVLAFQNGRIPLNEFQNRLIDLAVSQVGASRLDPHRGHRTGLPEAVLCQGKTPDQAAQALAGLFSSQGRALGTRADQAHYKALLEADPELDARYDPVSRLITIGPEAEGCGLVAVLSAGASDLAVAEEAAQTLTFLGSTVLRHFDSGVAGIHRLFASLDQLAKAKALVVVAGMDGALPSVVAGMLRPPVIGVPTSTGYGASFGGLAALLTMLNSCAPGVAVVNIDNGFGAACMAHTINLQSTE